jgi:hypothetical protein
VAVLGYKPLPLGRLFLSLPILPEPFNRRTASGSGEVAGRPEVCATGCQIREILAQHPTADALEVVHQRRDQARRRVLDQQLPVPHHQQSCSPRRSAPTARHPFSLRRPERQRASAPVQRRLSFLRHLEIRIQVIIGLEMLCLLRLGGGCVIAPPLWHDSLLKRCWGIRC